jgi:hypothetical protein
MASSGMLRRVILVRTNVSEELTSSFISLTRREEIFLRSVIRLIVTASVVPSSLILITLMKEAISSSETSVLTRAKRRKITGDAVLCREAVQANLIFDHVSYHVKYYVKKISIFLYVIG